MLSARRSAEKCNPDMGGDIPDRTFDGYNAEPNLHS